MGGHSVDPTQRPNDGRGVPLPSEFARWYEAEWATPEVLPPGGFDLAPLLPVIELPRSLQGPMPGAADPASRVTLHVQGLELTEERLVIHFGIVAPNR